jgi:molecular chaperone GrpE (heat shock protein)
VAKDREPIEDRIDEGDGVTAKGKALSRSEAELDILSRITDRDIQQARRDWKANCAEGFEGLIDATIEEG